MYLVIIYYILNIVTSAISYVSAGVHTMYGGGLSSSLIYNPDGVRCWLPCIDRIDRKTLFDIRVTGAPFAMTAGVPCGSPNADDKRFVTKYPIAASSLGIFTGEVESFTLELPDSDQECHIAVATGDGEGSHDGDNEARVKWTSLGLAFGI